MTETQILVEPLVDNTTLAIELNGEKILLCNAAGEHYAVENRCSHQNTPLENGRIRQGYICCPLHGVRFDLKTGEPKGELTRISLKTFPVNEENGKIRITLA
ncbi:MAG: 3-phenylpropionate/trans-cinnamate dioxygenase ferredoxin subunit [Candidatus Azotimanducaceae bacterium]|jgi:3-phenylpropionate/trans-cinnamate dioxygenase ferredoxin subunit